MTTATPATDLDALRQHLVGVVSVDGPEAAIEAALELLSRARNNADEVTLAKRQLEVKNRELELKLQQLMRERTGRRSEKVPKDQLALALGAINDDQLMDEGVDETANDDADSAPAARQSKRKAKRKKLSDTLPREIIDHEVAAAARGCPDCGVPMTCMGHDTSEVLDFVPARFIVREHRRAKYVCGGCKSRVVTAPGPTKVIDKGLPSAGLLAHILVNKYQDHLPLSRQAAMFEREGVELAESTLGGWVRQACEQLEPLARRLWTHLDDAYLVQVDASGLKVLDRGIEGNIRKGTVWCYVVHRADGRTVLFDYAMTGDGASGPWQRLGGRKGYIQADAASVFDRLYNGKAATATEVGCWAHARRKFFGLHETEPRAAKVIQLIGKMFTVERTADERAMSPEKRLQLRCQRSGPVTRKLYNLLTGIAAREPPQSALGKAAQYAINHRVALLRFLEDGRLPLTNNLDELQIRTLAIGRKNYLFAGSNAGAERAAIIYSLLRTCALHGVNPFAYLREVLTRLADGWPNSRVDELLPAAFAK